jgi:hypothetical protein
LGVNIFAFHNIKRKEKYPVVQIAYPDAESYAKKASKRLPTKAEFEFAARGGLPGKVYVWGNEFRLGGKWMANKWQGKFPVKDAGEDGYTGIAPVKSFPPNGYGLYDIAGNVWEWCSDWYRPDYYKTLTDKGGVAHNPQAPESPFDPSEPNEKKRVHRGGSFLCNNQYCSRYIVGTRGTDEVNTGTNHLGSMRSMARECRATNNARLGFLIKGEPLIKPDAKQDSSYQDDLWGRGPANAGFVLPFGAMPAASRSDSLLSTQTIYLSSAWYEVIGI